MLFWIMLFFISTRLKAVFCDSLRRHRGDVSTSASRHFNSSFNNPMGKAPEPMAGSQILTFLRALRSLSFLLSGMWATPSSGVRTNCRILSFAMVVLVSK